MNKIDLEAKWGEAAKFRLWRDGAEKFRAIFPDRETLMRFYDDVEHTTWPEFYGQSPYDDAFGIAWNVKHGLSQGGWEWLEKTREETSTRNNVACLALFGIYPLSNHGHARRFVVQSWDSSLGRWLDTIHGADSEAGIETALQTAREPNRWMGGEVGETRIAMRKGATHE